jgi:hypothetical protein
MIGMQIEQQYCVRQVRFVGQSITIEHGRPKLTLIVMVVVLLAWYLTGLWAGPQII